jgi:hypothetical protein
MAGEDEYEGYADDAPGVEMEQWWLAAPAEFLVWARLRVLDSGVAQVFDSQGETLVYESEDVARGALMDADFCALDGLDDDDAVAMTGLLADELQPPQGESEEQLLPQMIRTLGPKHSRH